MKVEIRKGKMVPGELITVVRLVTRDACVLDDRGQPTWVDLKVDPVDLVLALGGSSEFATITYATRSRVWLRRSQIGDVVETPLGLKGWGGPGSMVLMKYDPVIADPGSSARIDPLRAGALVPGASVDEVRAMIEADWDPGEAAGPVMARSSSPVIDQDQLSALPATIQATLRPQWHAVVVGEDSRDEEPQGLLYDLDPRGPGLDAGQVARVARIDLGSLDLGADPTMPDSGTLTFSYDTAAQPWGYEPGDARCFSVEYEPGGDLTREPDDTAVPVVFRQGVGMPPIDSADGESLQLESEDDADAYVEFYGELYGEPGTPGGVAGTWLGGYPYQLQDDMQEQCAEMALAAFGVESEPAEWRLLLQLASEPVANMSWGDCGFLYYWIREPDLAERRFDRVWCILQTM